MEQSNDNLIGLTDQTAGWECKSLDLLRLITRLVSFGAIFFHSE
jgi:hypothetical protein